MTNHIFKIIHPTSDKFTQTLYITMRLFSKYFKTKPGASVVAHNKTFQNNRSNSFFARTTKKMVELKNISKRNFR